MPRVYRFNDFIKRLYGKDDSVFTCVEGPKGSGKTGFNLLQLERIHDQDLGHRYGSNMPIPEALQPSFEMDFIEDFETLEKTCRMLNPKPTPRNLKKYFFFLSELGKFAPRDQAWKKENIEFIQKLQTVRKYGLSMLTDAIDRVDARILSPRFFHGVFEKPFSENPRFARWRDFRTGRQFIFKDIPKCKMWFDTYYSANFYMEPQGQADAIPLDPNAQIVKRYLDNDCSWKKAGIETKKGKRAMVAVATAYLRHYRAFNQEPNEDNTISEPSTEIKEEVV